MRCFHCHKPIHKQDHYFIFTEYLEMKQIRKDYCHKICWDEVKKAISHTDKLMNMTERMMAGLTEKGLIPERVVTI